MTLECRLEHFALQNQPVPHEGRQLRDVTATLRPEVKISRLRVAASSTADEAAQLLAASLPARLIYGMHRLIANRSEARPRAAASPA